MQTWLDAFTHMTADAAREEMDRHGRASEAVIARTGTPHPWRRMSNPELFVYHGHRRMAASDRGKDPWVDVLEFAIPFVANVVGNSGVMVKMLGDRPSPLTAVRPSADLVDALSAAHPPANQEETALADLCRSFWYVDLPPGALVLGDPAVTVRALFTRPVDAEHLARFERVPGVSLRMAAVLTEPGSARVLGTVLWVWGQPDSAYCALQVAGVDLQLLCREIEEFLCLLVLYRRTADKADRSAVPHLTLRALRALRENPRREAQKRKKFSMFHVETLAPPRDRFGRRAAERPGVWKLGWRSTVRGHFRMQPHGPQRSLRKLIWVDPFERGPADGLHKIELERLDGP